MNAGAKVTIACAISLAYASLAAGQPFPSRGSPNPAMISAAPAGSTGTAPATPAPTARAAAPPSPTVALPAGSVPRPVTVARATAIPQCTVFVDAAAPRGGAGTVQNPHNTISEAVAKAPAGAVICVAEGTYREQIKAGEKHFTLAGGFQGGSKFTVRDSARYMSKAQGRGGSFLSIKDSGPTNQLTAIDGFEITGYSQAIVRDYYESQRFDVTNNFIHHNTCATKSLAGAGVALNNVTGRIQGNVFQSNACGRGGAIFVDDSQNKNTVLIENNLIDANAGTEPDSPTAGPSISLQTRMS